MTSTLDLGIKQSRLCRILTGTAAALSVLLYMEFRHFEGSMKIKPVEILSVPEQRLLGKLRKNSTVFQADAAYRRCRLSSVQPEKCYLAYTKSCVKAKNIVTKIIRLDIHHTKVLLQKYQRGIVNCRLNHTSWYPISDKSGARKRIKNNVKILCSKMRSDMEGARKLARQFPNRVRIIQYEDIVRAQEKQDALYRYIGAVILKENIHLPHLAGKIQTSSPYSFRDQLSQSSLDIVQEYCSDIIEMLGLRVFNSYDELRNISIQVEKRREFPFSI